MSDTAIQKQQDTVQIPKRAQQEQQAQTWYTPLVDIAENDAAFLFQADLPGVSPANVDVNYENNVLTIAAKVQPRQPAGQRYAWREYGVGHFYRQFTISTPVDADAIRAQLKSGVLELYVPKASSARPRKIAVKSE